MAIYKKPQLRRRNWPPGRRVWRIVMGISTAAHRRRINVEVSLYSTFKISSYLSVFVISFANNEHHTFCIPKFNSMSFKPFNVLTTNAVDLQRLLTSKQITSIQIVQQYFDQIDRHEPFLNALISPAPRNKVLRVAAALDEERSNGSVRSPFHGIPIVLKVSINRNSICTPRNLQGQ